MGHHRGGDHECEQEHAHTDCDDHRPAERDPEQQEHIRTHIGRGETDDSGEQPYAELPEEALARLAFPLAYEQYDDADRHQCPYGDGEPAADYIDGVEPVLDTCHMRSAPLSVVFSYHSERRKRLACVL